MDFLNKAFAQVSDLFRSMTPGARITAGLLLVVVVVSLGYLFTAQVSGPDCDLMNGVPVPPDQLQSMKAAFGKAGLNSYEIRGTQILVPRGQRDRYMAALADAGALPLNIDEVLDEAVKDTSPFIGKQQQEARLKVARQKTLAMIIRSMRGIENAYVMYAQEEKPQFRRERVTTASVSVKPTGTEQLDESQVSAIRHLVAGAIAGLKPEHVTVADLNGPIHYGGDPDSGASARENLYVSLKRIYEQEWKNKILNALAYVPGVKVTPNVTLDREQINRTKSIKYDPKPTAVREIDESSESTREAAGPAGRPGYLAQQANTATAIAVSPSKGSNDSESESKREVISLPNTEQTELQKIGLTPQRVSVSIGIPSSYFEMIWKKHNPPSEGQEPQTPDPKALDDLRNEETTKIQEYVATLLPAAEGVTGPANLVTVKMFQDIQPAEIPAPGLGENAMAWLGDYWSTLGMIGLAMFSLMMLRSMVRTAPTGPEDEAAARVLPMHAGEEEKESAEQVALKSITRFTGSGPSLRDELSELVQEDPDTAANILRNWIGNVG